MCKQTQSITLQTAVLMQVKEFADAASIFSVHDITRTLREKTANGDLEIPEVEVGGASFRFDISHAKVKGLFDELYRTGVFDPMFTLSRQFNGMYFEYTPTLVAVTGAAAVTTNVPASYAPIAAPLVAPSVAANGIVARVQLYLTNCVNRNFRPTLKNVQSAIKRGDQSTGTSCDDLKTMIQGLGYTVVDDPASVARAQVATV